MGAMRVQKLMMWRIKLRGRVGRPRKRRLRRLAVRYGYEGDILISDLAIVKSFIKQTLQEYKTFRPKAHEFRATYLGHIADELAMEDGVSAETHFRNLMQREETKNKLIGREMRLWRRCLSSGKRN